MPKSSKRDTSQQSRQSRLAEVHSWIIREIHAGKYVPTPPPGWQPPKENKENETQSTENIAPTDKNELTSEEKS